MKTDLIDKIFKHTVILKVVQIIEDHINSYRWLDFGPQALCALVPYLESHLPNISTFVLPVLRISSHVFPLPPLPPLYGSLL